MEENKEIELRSDEVQEILTQVPNWMIRWGITLIFVLLGLFLFLSWMIKYPDIISGTATLTTVSPPIRLVNKSSGQVEKIFVSNKANVKENQAIATISSTLTLEAKQFLSVEIKLIQSHLTQHNLETLKLKDTQLIFGPLQEAHNTLQKAIKDYSHLILQDNFSFNIKNTQAQLKNQKALKRLLEKQQLGAKKLLDNAQNKFKSDQTLFEKGVISQSEYFEREKAYQMVLNEVNSIGRSIINTSIAITDLEKQINTLQFDFDEKKRTLLLEIDRSLTTIQNALNTWEESYVLHSPIAGKLSYLQPLVENEFVEQGKTLFAIVPKNETFIAQLQVPKKGIGKVEVGQKVMLSIDNYPANEYGELSGKVSSIALIANEENYLVKVALTKGLATTYNKIITYTPEMSGSAKIITKDLRITDRIFNQFRKIFDNR